jgi:hypothetical protein
MKMLGQFQEGGAAMERFFEYYRAGRIINPLAGKEINVKPME